MADRLFNYYLRPENDPDLGSVITAGFEDKHNPHRSFRIGVVPSIGGTIYSWEIGGLETVVCDKKALAAEKVFGPFRGLYTLTTFPGRMRGRTGVYEGTLIDGRVPLPPGVDDPNLFHGNGRLREYTAPKESYEGPVPVVFEMSVQFGKDKTGKPLPYYEAYPFDVRLTHKYYITPDGLKVKAVYENLGNIKAPVAHALHTNWVRNDESKIQVSANSYIPLKDNMPELPIKLQPVHKEFDLRTRTNVRGLRLDDYLTDLDPTKPVVYSPGKMPFEIWTTASKHYRYCVVFTKMDDSISIEMQSSSPDALAAHNAGQTALANVIELETKGRGKRVEMETNFQIHHLRAA